MAKITVQVRLDSLKKLQSSLMNDSLAVKVGTMLKEESRRAIANGLSPVRGVGRFAAYKNPSQYPGDRKPARPVNLQLTGDLLSHLGYRRSGNRLEFGLIGMSGDVAKRAETHQKGTHPHVPRRQFIPEAGQEFIATIATKMRQLFRERISEIIRESKS